MESAKSLSHQVSGIPFGILWNSVQLHFFRPLFVILIFSKVIVSFIGLKKPMTETNVFIQWPKCTLMLYLNL